MKISENKLYLSEADLEMIKRANTNSSPSVAAMFLKSLTKSLVEDTEEEKSLEFYIEAINLYRKKQFEVTSHE